MWWDTRTLQQKFFSLNPLRGKTRLQIEAVVGPSSSFSAMAHNQVLLQWIETGYHVALIFSDNTPNAICGGVTHESSV